MYEPKTYEENRTHFIERLAERYEISITNEEYDLYCNGDNGTFHGFLAKNSAKTVGYVFIKDRKVYVLRRGDINCLATCYPPSVEFSHGEMLKSCFSGKLRWVVRIIFRRYLWECQQVAQLKFDTIKDAALYYFANTLFAPLHIDKYKHGTARSERMASMVNSIIKGESPYVYIDVIKRKMPLHKRDVKKNSDSENRPNPTNVL